MNRVDFLLWIVFPYVAIAVCVGGHIWRYRRDQFTWTTRSTQLLERRQLRPAILLFHLGLLAVFGGHVVGLLIPSSFTEAVGITEDAYHVLSLAAGITAGTAVAIGLALLIIRRESDARVRATNTLVDRMTYPLLGLVIVMGMIATLGPNLIGGGYDYRVTVSPWFRGIFALDPNVDLIAGAPLAYRIHAAAAFLLFALWPFSRLVHMWSIPIAYLGRSHIVYRTRRGIADAAARRADV